MNEAQIPNPALEKFTRLIGEWKTEGTHPLVPNKIFHGHSSFKWIEGGAFLIMYSEIDEPEIPSGIAIFGSDDASADYYMLYFDERKVSRKFNISIHGDDLTWWRDAPDFSQRFTWTFTDNDNTIISRGQYSKDTTTWEEDLSLTFTRVNP